MSVSKKSSGFTIIELMMGMLASTIVALAAGSMLYYTWIGWRNTRESVAMQRNAMVAMRTIEHRIRNANFSEVGGLGSQTLTFSAEPDFAAADITPGTETLLQAFDAQPDGRGGVLVSFELETARGADSGYYQMTVYPRN